MQAGATDGDDRARLAGYMRGKAKTPISFALERVFKTARPGA